MTTSRVLVVTNEVVRTLSHSEVLKGTARLITWEEDSSHSNTNRASITIVNPMIVLIIIVIVVVVVIRL